GKTSIYALKTPLALSSVLTFDEPRYVADSEHGGLVVRGRCSSEPRVEPGYYCLFSKQSLREIKVRGDVGAERVALFKDGTAAVIAPPRRGALATLTLVDRSGATRQKKLKLPKSGPLAKLLREGIWLDGFRATGKGKLAGWVAGAGPFVGIVIEPDGTVKGGKILEEVERTFLSGRFALLRAQYGQALQSVDGGASWMEVATLEPTERDAVYVPNSEQGCSAIGCATGQWLRVGWSQPKQRARTTAVEPPERTRLPSPGGGRWTLQCYANGQASPRALPTETADAARE